MALKSEELINPESCMNRAAGDEMVFVLREKDPLFARCVRFWAQKAVGLHENEKVEEAMQVATDAEARSVARYGRDSI